MTPPRLCPICNRPLPQGEEAARFRPFCCKRCADIDLGRWLKGAYGIPATETEDESEGEGEAGPAGAEASGEDSHGVKGPLRH